LQGVGRDEAIAAFGKRLLHCTRNATLTFCPAGEVLSHSHYLMATGFTGDPTAPVTRNGCATSRNV